jgi:predicted glycosyltransferase
MKEDLRPVSRERSVFAPVSTVASPESSVLSGGTDATMKVVANPRPKKIWVDLENSPHVPFFKPIIEQLEKRGHSVMVTARDCFQVCELADLFHMKYKKIGHHYGKHTLAKLTGLGVRVLQMTPTVLREKPDLALSHGSRSLFLLSSLLRIPTLTIFDYEHTKWVSMFQPTWVMAPDIVPDEAICSRSLGVERLLRYPGIKEDVYAPSFKPDPKIREKLGVGENDLLVTIRPPATEAHYHNPESEKLLNEVFEFLGQLPEIKIVLVPRTPKQGVEIRQQWPQLFERGQMTIPEHVVDGLDLIWTSDLVISGGGTMNREAAALGVPVYSIFRGTIGAVDHYLSEQGRLVLLESTEDVRTKLRFTRRNRSVKRQVVHSPTLQKIVDNIEFVLESK